LIIESEEDGAMRNTIILLGAIAAGMTLLSVAQSGATPLGAATAATPSATISDETSNVIEVARKSGGGGNQSATGGGGKAFKGTGGGGQNTTGRGGNGRAAQTGRGNRGARGGRTGRGGGGGGGGVGIGAGFEGGDEGGGISIGGGGFNINIGR
jgi:hypothetical protein